MSGPVTIDSKQFRHALGSFTTGVTVVTTRAGDQDVGLTANSFNSVSLDPPLVLWSLAKTSNSLQAFVEAEHFTVHVLSADQETVSNRFATRGADKFGGLDLERGPGDVPLLRGCTARFHCRTAYRYEGGDHEIFVGEVVGFDHFPRPPLVFHGGTYGLLLEKATHKRAAQLRPNAAEREIASNFSIDFLGYLLGVGYMQLLAKLRTELQQRSLTTEQYWFLNLLARFEQRSLGELDSLFAVSGSHITPQLIQAMVERGLLHETGAVTEHTSPKLTQEGRRVLIELVAAAKSAEADYELCLDYGEMQVLKQLLRKLVRASSATPAGWRKSQQQ